MKKAFLVALVMLTAAAVVATVRRLPRGASAFDPPAPSPKPALRKASSPIEGARPIFAYAPIKPPEPRPPEPKQARAGAPRPTAPSHEPLLDFDGKQLETLAQETAAWPRVVIEPAGAPAALRRATVDLCRSVGALYWDEVASEGLVPERSLAIVVARRGETGSAGKRVRGASAWVQVVATEYGRRLLLGGRTQADVLCAVHLAATRLKQPIRDSFALRAQLTSADCERPAAFCFACEPEPATAVAAPGDLAAWRVDVCHESDAPLTVEVSHFASAAGHLPIPAPEVRRIATEGALAFPGARLQAFRPVSLWVYARVPGSAGPGRYACKLELSVTKHTRALTIPLQVVAGNQYEVSPPPQVWCDVSWRPAGAMASGGTDDDSYLARCRGLAEAVGGIASPVFVVDALGTLPSGQPLICWRRAADGFQCEATSLIRMMESCRVGGEAHDWVLRLSHRLIEATPVVDGAGKPAGVAPATELASAWRKSLLPRLSEIVGLGRVKATGTPAVLERWQKLVGEALPSTVPATAWRTEASHRTCFRRDWWQKFAGSDSRPTTCALGALPLFEPDENSPGEWRQTRFCQQWLLGQQDYAFLRAAATELGRDRVARLAKEVGSGPGRKLPSEAKRQLADELQNRDPA